MRRTNLKVKVYGSGVAEAANEAPVNQRMKRAGARWSMRPERPRLRGDPFRRCMAGNGQNARRQRKSRAERRLTVENPGVKSGFSQK